MTASTGNPENTTNRPKLAVGAYEQQLHDDSRWALSEGSRHFDEKSAVFAALQKIARRLDELRIPYAIVGGMALFHHGFRRFTEGVDILVKKSDLKLIHEKLEGLGYSSLHKHSKHLRDTENGVKIEFVTSGDYPGDGKEKPVAFPEPSTVAQRVESLSYVNLASLVELKLASGMTGAGRLKDLSDVVELIKLLNLPIDFAERLNPYVRDKYKELWKQSRRRYITLWRDKWLTAGATTIDEMIASSRHAVETLEAMKRDGVVLEPAGVDDDYAHLVTTDPEVAKKYDMVEESEFWGQDDEDAAK
ncbi:MAG: hypothetical protein WD063_00375 [Pirellulales bacterium]